MKRWKPASTSAYRRVMFEMALAEQPETIVEVGVYEGALSRMLATVPSVKRLWIIDSWEAGYSGFDEAHMMRVAKKVIDWAETLPKVSIRWMRSAEAAPLFADGAVDFWHTDGDHSLEGITTDIEAWWPKVRPGGIVSGDNYEIPEVAAGVDRLLPARQFAANGRIWWLQKPS